MCGIIGYIGQKEAYNILLQGLQHLEYRGYDSAGIATIHNNILLLNKKIGRVQTLQQTSLPGTMGIAHTRWATHGKPADKNAHPFTDQNNQFAIVHNGIIENYLELKEQLRKDNIQFTSDTDSEVIVHLIAKQYTTSSSLRDAILKTLPLLHGAYAFCAINKDTNEIIGARNGSPLVIGIGNNENFFASDVSAIIEHTKQVIYLNDFECAKITHTQVELFNFQNKPLQKNIKTINWNLEQAQKQGYKHFMLKEIFEQPLVIKESFNIPLPKFSPPPQRIIIVACGTASYAGFVAKYLIEKIAKINVINETASEFRYKQPLIHKDDLIIAISQSGETADTLAAIRLAKSHHAHTLGIINVVDSTIAREVDQVIYTRAGPEIGVASTKAFTSQLSVLYNLAFHLANLPLPDTTELLTNLDKVISLNDHIKQLAQKYLNYHNFMYIGRNINFPLALEGALKLKEISYIHAEAYAAGELKHGPIALIAPDMPTIAICPKDDLYNKTISNIQEINARSGNILVITSSDDRQLETLTPDIIKIPQTDPLWYPLLITIPLQLLAYHIADMKECDIDKPRNLAKSVTVE